MNAIRKAVTFRASSIGDCLMGKYLLENIHAQFPEARCAIVVASRGGMIRDLFAAYSWLEVREVNRFNLGELWRLWRDFRGSDIVVTQYAGKPGGRFSMRSKLFARLLARRGALAGFVDASQCNRFIYDTLVPFDIAVAPAEHERRALRAIGLSVPLPYPRLVYRKENDELVLKQFGLASGTYLVVHLFAGNASRDLSPEKRGELVRALHDGMKNTTLVITGSAADEQGARAAAEAVPAIVIAGKASLQELMCVIAHSAGVVSVETGIAHVAAQLGVKHVALTTCLAPNWWLPEQYDTPFVRISREDLCMGGHVYEPYPVCINAIDMGGVVRTAVPFFGI